MITITGFLHRKLLRDIIGRWMYGEVHAGDADHIVRLVNFNNEYIGRCLSLLSRSIFQHIHGSGLFARSATSKGELKDVVILNPPYRTPRIDDLIGKYCSEPGLYYRETPFQGTLFFVTKRKITHYVGSCRIKRMRRLAEKAARRLVDQFFLSIREKAEFLSDESVCRDGTSLLRDVLRCGGRVSREFLAAEEHFLDDLKKGRPITGVKDVLIHDMGGIKVICESSDLEGFIDYVRRRDDIHIEEEEKHCGTYNATNLTIRYRPQKDEILALSFGDNTRKIMLKYDDDESRLKERFRDFVRSGEDEIYVEVIISSYQEMLESEIGRCIHEDRIISQRLHREYRGHLARNIEYLMEYLFVSAHAPRHEISDLPIKVWNRYLPDYFDMVLKELFDLGRADDPE